MIVTISKNKILFFIIFILIIAVLAGSIYFTMQAKAVTTPKNNITIAIDAGHGGKDAGATGKTTKIKESEINLAVAKKLRVYLQSAGFDVLLTRENESGIYEDGASVWYKSVDMKKRKKLIENSKVHAVVSIHQNAIPVSYCRGLSVFYREDDKQSQLLADAVKDSAKIFTAEARDIIKPAEYYMLYCSPAPSILVECGFLTNYEDEKLLASDDYQGKIAYSIFCGIVKYFGTPKY